MNKKKLILIVIAVSVIAVLAIGALIQFKGGRRQYFSINVNGVEKKVNFLNAHEDQKSGRKYIDKKLRYLFTIENSKEHPLYMPLKIITDDEDNIYVQDTSDRSIKVYSPDGKFIRKYGGRGEGPGEFSILNDFYIENNIVYALADNKISVFSGNGVKELKLKGFGGVNAVLPYGNEEFILLKMPLKKEETILGVYNNVGNETASFEPLYKTGNLENMEGALFHGEIFKSSKRLIFISQYFNLIFIYNGTKLDKMITTVDKEEHPLLVVKSFKDGRMADVRDIKIINRNAYLVNDALYILSGAALKEYKKFIFDVYDSGSGEYNGSLRFDQYESFYGCSVSHNRLFIIDKDFKIKVFGYE